MARLNYVGDVMDLSVQLKAFRDALNRAAAVEEIGRNRVENDDDLTALDNELARPHSFAN